MRQSEFSLAAPSRKPLMLDLQNLYAKPTFLAALKYVIQCGNFEYEKEVYQSLGIDAGNWTRIMNGSASFPQDKEEQLQELCGNHGLVIWRAFRIGKGLHDLEDAKDKEARLLREENELLKTEISTLIKYGVVPGPKS